MPPFHRRFRHHRLNLAYRPPVQRQAVAMEVPARQAPAAQSPYSPQFGVEELKDSDPPEAVEGLGNRPLRLVLRDHQRSNDWSAWWQAVDDGDERFMEQVARGADWMIGRKFHKEYGKNAKKRAKYQAIAARCGHEDVFVFTAFVVLAQTPDDFRQTALHRAAAKGHVAVCQALLKVSRKNEKDYNDDSALHLAVKNKHFDVCRHLLEAAADANLENKSGLSPLELALDPSSDPALRELLYDKATTQSSWSLLVQKKLLKKVVRSSDGDSLSFLLTKGSVSLDSAEISTGKTLLHSVAARGIAGCLEALLAKAPSSVNVENASGQPPLFAAMRHGHESCVALLVKEGANPTHIDAFGQSALHLAAQHGQAEVLEPMLKRFKACPEGPLLIEREIFPGRRGWTALHLAAWHGYGDCVKLLLAARRSLLLPSKPSLGEEMLHLAAQQGHSEVAQALLAERPRDQAYLNCKDNLGWAPLHKAAAVGHTAVMKLLLEAKCKVEPRSASGWTPLHRATYNGHLEAVKLLLEFDHGVDVKSKDDQTPDDKAEARYAEAERQGNDEAQRKFRRIRSALTNGMLQKTREAKERLEASRLAGGPPPLPW